MVTRDGAFYETLGTLLRIIEDYRHFIESREPASTNRGSQSDAAPPSAALSQRAEAREQNGSMPAPDASRHTAILETAGAVPSSKAGPRSEGQPDHTAEVELGAVPASPKPKPPRSESVAPENLSPLHNAEPPVPKRRRVRQTERLVLEPHAPARTPAVESGNFQSGSSLTGEVEHGLLPQPVSNAVATKPEGPEAGNTIAAEKAARRGGGRPRASRQSIVRETTAPEPQPKLQFTQPATSELDAVKAKGVVPEVDPTQTSTGRLRTTKQHAGQPKTPRWVTAGAARRGRQK